MARWTPAQPIYEAADLWRERCLLGEGSVFTEAGLWNAKNAAGLDAWFVQNLDEGSGSFFAKLEQQLRPAPPEVKKLASEIFWVMFLFPSSDCLTPATKRAQIKTVWEWSGEAFPERSPLEGEILDTGIGNPGTGFMVHRWRELIWFILALCDWYAIGKTKREALLSDPWRMAGWIHASRESAGRQLPHIVLHLLYPESFERIGTARHKREIVRRLSETGSPEVDPSDRLEIDRRVLAIRKSLESSEGDGFDFYDQGVRDRWLPPGPLVGPAPVPRPDSGGATPDMGRLAGRFGGVRFWVLGTGAGGQLWPEFRDEGMVAIGWDWLGDLFEYGSQEQMEDALKQREGSAARPYNNALACYQFAHVMEEGDVVIAKHGRFGLYGYGVVRSAYRFDDSRPRYMHVRDVGWLKTGTWRVPEQRGITVKTLTNFTDYPDWLQMAIGLMDAGEYHPDEAGEVAEPTPAYGGAEALQDLFVSPDELDGMLQALRRTKALILTGPPGVGKTFVSRRLAWALMHRRDDDRVRFVQFHQSYSYEDFVQGWRPTPSGGFELRDGVFYTFCRQAQADPRREYVCIIDEINRANLSKVFGELLMLIEADKRSPAYAVRLAYAPESDAPFHVPENVYVIGLMNTADRSLAIVDYALRRRFSFMNLRPAFSTEAFYRHLETAGADPSLIDLIVERMGALNAAIASDTANLGPGFEIGHSYFVPREEDAALDRDWYTRIIRHEIEPLLCEYWFDRPERVAEEVGRLLA